MFFDRFPRIPVNWNADPLTPDFSIFFNNDYGIVFEISRTFPREDEALAKEMEQLLSYDKITTLNNGQDQENINNYDIVLLLSILDSNEISSRIKKYLETKNIKFNHNFIILEYTFNSSDTKPYYLFRKNYIYQSKFSDYFPTNISLANTMDILNRSIRVNIEHMIEYKLKGVLCNDQPPPVYLIGHIWHKVLNLYLTEEDEKVWKEKRFQNIIPIKITVNDLKLKTENTIKSGKIKKIWIEAALNFLVICKFATKESDEEYIIHYRNLRSVIENNYSDDFIGTRSFIRELQHYLIKKYCDNTKSIKEKEKTLSKNQETLDKIL